MLKVELLKVELLKAELLKASSPVHCGVVSVGVRLVTRVGSFNVLAQVYECRRFSKAVEMLICRKTKPI